jgi:hypothetical protein
MKTTLCSWLAALSLIGTSSISFAQSLSPPVVTSDVAPVVAATPPAVPTFVDVHPFQSQITIRSNGAGLENGNVQVMPAVTVGEYKYHVPGILDLQSAFNTALLYEKRNPLGATVAAGGNYTFYDGGYMSTIDANGTFLYKGDVTFKPAILGGVYFTDSVSGHIVLVDSYGFYWDSMTAAPSIRMAGGNYFIDTTGVVTTFKSVGTDIGNGTGMMTVKIGMDFSSAKLAGGNFFVLGDNSIVTVNSVNGFVSMPYTVTTTVKVVGGNYFIGDDNFLYTIDNQGVLNKNTSYVVGQPVLRGYSFLRFADGTFIFVDGSGMPHRSILDVSSTGIQVENLTQLPITIDMRSIYLPNNQKN